MKKLLAVFLIFVMLLSVMAMSVSAQSSDISDEIFNVIKTESTSVEITKDDVDFNYIKQLTDNKYLVKYIMKQCVYPSVYGYMDIGWYVFGISPPLPEIYYKGNLYDVEEAYERGMLKQQDLELMDSFSELNFERTKVSYELDVNSSYGDPEEYIYVRIEVQGSDKDVVDFENWKDDISGTYDKLEAFQETLHERLINETLKDYDHIDVHHSQGVSVVAVKRADVKKIAENEFVEYMDYLTNVHAKFIETYTPNMKDYTFNEVCRGYDENHNESYVLIKAYGGSCADAVIGFRYGDVVLKSGGIYGPFPFQFGLYDIKEDKVYDLLDLIDTPDKYYGLQEDLLKYTRAYRVGDRDRDGVVSVMDATGIQLMLSGLEGDVYDDYYSAPRGVDKGYITDFDKDGEVTVLDATAIQLHLVQVD